VRPAALLCLDEPTNHLDLASREVLESALAAFPGTIVFISHDRYFINRIATAVVEVAAGRLTSYPGSYDDYLDAKARAADPTAAAAAGAGHARPAARPAPEPTTRPPRLARASKARAGADGERRAAARPAAAPTPAPAAPVARIIKKKPAPEVRELRRRVEELEHQIHALEQRIAQIGATLTDPKLYLDGDRVRAVSRERKAAEEQMTGLLREWEEVSTALAAHE